MERAAISASAVRGLTLRALLRALRPDEWVKNLFVFAALLFGDAFSWTNAARATATFVAFCAIASAGYLVNDIRDIELDRRHPAKRFRAIASGELPVRIARIAAAVLALAGLLVSLAVSPAVCAMVAGYGVLTLAYSLVLKTLVIIDVMTIAAGFLVRVLAGAVAVDVTPSPWLVVCTGMVSLFLGFTKRRQEAVLEREAPCGARPVLEHYPLPFLDQMVSLVSAGTVLSYTIYATQSPNAGDKMLWTVPMVLYGIFRYLYLVYHRQDGSSTSELLTHDPGILGAAVTWVVAAALVTYL